VTNTIRIRRRVSGATGAPSSLENAELAFNEINDVLWYGKGTGGAGGTATSIIAIGGDGAYLNLTGTQTVSGAKTFTGGFDISGATVSGFTTTGAVTIGGDLTVNGTTTTINSTTVLTDDKNIELGSTATPTDAGADSGGIILKGTTDKSILWYDSTDSWTFNQNVELTAGLSYRIDGAGVLSKTALGSTVVSSSLTSVGTLTSGALGTGFTTVSTALGGTGYANGYANGELLIGNSSGSLTKATLTAGTGISITNASGSITINAQETLSAGDGIDFTAGVVSVDLKANGGLVIESTELALDLSASAITGTLAIADGGTGATDAGSARTSLGLAIGTNVQAWDADLDTLSGMQTGAATALALLTSSEVAIIDGSTSATATTLALADRMVVNDNGTMVQVALSDLVTFLENGAVSGFDIDGGTY
jgi:hypothetical protein